MSLSGRANNKHMTNATLRAIFDDAINANPIRIASVSAFFR